MSTAALQTPTSIGSVTIRNRTVMSSLTRNRAFPNDIANDEMALYYKQRAEGGVGLIMSEGTLVSPQGVEWGHAPGIYSSAHAVGWKLSTDAVHAAGGRIFAQLWHVGRVAHPDMPLQQGRPVQAPSKVSARGGKFRTLPGKPGYVSPTEELADPRTIVQDFKKAAEYAKEAGFDGVEIHSANGYLFAQFLDPKANTRTDEWGGSIENRSRFLFEVLDAVIPVWGADRVGVKLSPLGGYNDVGVNDAATLTDFTYVISNVVARRLSHIQLVRWGPGANVEYDGEWRVDTKLDLLKEFGPLIKGTGTKLMLNFALGPAEAEKLLEAELIDAAVFGRAWINNPDFATRLFERLPLNEDLGFPAKVPHFYDFPGGKLQDGYSDYPTYEEAVAKRPTA